MCLSDQGPSRLTPDYEYFHAPPCLALRPSLLPSSCLLSFHLSSFFLILFYTFPSLSFPSSLCLFSFLLSSFLLLHVFSFLVFPSSLILLFLIFVVSLLCSLFPLFSFPLFRVSQFFSSLLPFPLQSLLLFPSSTPFLCNSLFSSLLPSLPFPSSILSYLLSILHLHSLTSPYKFFTFSLSLPSSLPHTFKHFSTKES